jgi:hypothetical protein
MQKFWCCFVEGTGCFSFKHLTKPSAVQEAERLARLPNNKDREVYVLKAISYCKTEYPPITWHEFEE